MTHAMPLLTPSYQELSLVAMLRYFDHCKQDEEGYGYSIFIKIRALSDDPIRWSLSLIQGGFTAQGDGATFAAAWDATMACCDEQFADSYAAAKKNGAEIPKPALMVDNLRPWREMTTALSPQEVEIVMNLRRRGATPDEYIIFLEINAEDAPGKWSVSEKKCALGVADTLTAAWDDRF
jgi:hypothetical protein